MNAVNSIGQKSHSEKIIQGTAEEHNHIECLIAVMSGKGGVGKSFVTGLLASELAGSGYRVGILDADITGPSIPTLFGLHGPVEIGQDGILPLCSRSGIEIISMNLLISSEDQPVIWRGPLISKAIKQLWGDVMWGKLDYLLVDLPPGTSDAALTILRSLPVNGVILVTTPQKLAGLIVNKALYMAQRIGVRIAGIVENMAYYRCPDTGKKHFIFGQCHGDSIAAIAKAPLLAQIPLDPDIARLCDSGRVEEIELEESRSLIEKFVASAPVARGKNNHDSVELSDIVRQLIVKKENLGTFDNPDARGKFRGWCGDTMQIDLRLTGETVQEARFATDGCEVAAACGSMITKMASSKTIKEAMKITSEDVLTALGGLPEDHEHCTELAVNTLQEALKNAIETRGNPI